MTMLKPLLFLVIASALAPNTSPGQVSHCVYGITVKELLKLAGVSGRDLLSYVVKVKKHNIDEIVLGSLTLQQLSRIGITALGDRLKIHKFFANDGNDCSSSSCKNNGICQDGFRCFSCRCDRSSGYYGPSYSQKCPCRNGGYCKTTRTGFKCECAPGYSGDLCETEYLKEDMLLDLKKELVQLTAKLARTDKELNNQKKQIESLQNASETWQLHRENKILNKLEKFKRHQSRPTYYQKLPIALPKGTRAILISIFYHFRNRNGHADLYYEAYQKGNNKPEGKVYGHNLHYNVYENTFYYEQMVPWSNDLPNELVFKVTYSYSTGGSSNWYRVRLVGYITTK